MLSLTMLRATSLAFLFVVSARLLAVSIIVYGQPARCGLNNGSFILNVNGIPPFTYAWSTGATTANVSGLAPGDYTLTVTDAGGSLDTTLTIEALFELQFIGGPEVAMIQNDCDNMCTGMVQISTNMLMGTEPYTFQFPPMSQGAGMAFFSGLCAGNSYLTTVTDANGCPGTVDLSNVVMAVSPSIVNVTGTTPACDTEANGTITVVLDGIAASEVQVSRVGGGYSQTHYPAWGVPYVINELPAGDYDLISAIPLLGCSQGYSATVAQLPAPCGSVSGTVFNDADQDCIQDPGEPGLPYRVLSIDPGPAYAIANAQGSYYSASGFGSFTLAQPLVDEAQLCPTTVPAPFTIDAGTPDVTLDLADSSFAPLDTRVSLWASAARPGFPASVYGTYWNASAYPSGEVTLVLHYDPMLDPVTVSPTPTNLTPGTAEWSLSGLDAFQSMHFQLQGTVPPDIGLLGTVITFLATASDGAQEVDMVNNAAAQNVTITGSVDPNDKTARTSSGLSTTQYFLDQDTHIDYTVRFQNTGTDTAFTVVVRDSLEFDLDPASLEILGASHAFTPSFGNGRTLVFTFNNINLPDSGTDHAASCGSVHFRLRPRVDIGVGEMISNSAGIWFDFNEPVVTNTSELLVESSTSVADNENGELVLWPNPSEDLLRVSINDTGLRLFQLDVLALDGRVVLRDGAFVLSEALDTRPLRRGAYLLRLQFPDGRVLQAPFVKR